jgi:PhnB protein
MSVNPIPEGYHTVTPYLIVEGADRVVDFIQRAFQGTEKFRMPNEDGTIAHAEVQIGDSSIMVSDAGTQWPAMPCHLHLYVEDCDAVYQRAIQAGGISVQEPADQFYGDRSAGVRDSGGNLWWLATHVEDVAPEEMAARAERRQTPQEG